jgi:hypothetical protein
MMKEPKQKEMDDFEDRVAAVQLQLAPSWNKNRDMATIMVEHELLPPIPKGKELDKQWQIDELTLRLEFCYAEEISVIYANKLNKIQNSYSLPARVHSNYFKKAHRKAEFEILESSNETCRMRCRLNPTSAWFPVTFDIIDAQDNKLLEKNNPNWKGNGAQNMLAKNCRHKAELILDPSILGNMIMEENLPEIPDTEEEEKEIKTQIVSFSKTDSVKPSPFAPIAMDIPTIEPAVMDIIEIVEPSSEAVIESHNKAIEEDHGSFTAQELTQIRDQKISELPPGSNTEPEILDHFEEGMLEQAELEKADTSFLDKTPLKESNPVELRKPFGMAQLTINDPKYHTQQFYDRIGDDWFRSFTIKESIELAGVDMNIEAFVNVLTPTYPDQLPKIQAKYTALIKESMDSEKLVVLFHDAMTMVENPPDQSIIDLKYFELMTNMAVAMEKVAELIKATKPENPMQFIIDASKGKWTNKEALWGYKYMEARGLI